MQHILDTLTDMRDMLDARALAWGLALVPVVAVLVWAARGILSVIPQ